MVRELSFSERRDWLRLIRTQNVGPVSFRDLINRYGDAGTALEELPYLIRKKTIRPPRPEQVEAEMEYTALALRSLGLAMRQRLASVSQIASRRS